MQDPKIVNSVVKGIMKMQAQSMEEQTVLKLLQKEKKQTQVALDNIVKAIERGIMSDTTNKRLNDLERQIKELDEKIAVEQNKVAYILSEGDIRRYYISAMQQEPQILINILVKEITLYDDKMIITYNTPLNEGSDENRGFSFYEKMLYLPYVVPQSGQTVSIPIYTIMQI